MTMGRAVARGALGARAHPWESQGALFPALALGALFLKEIAILQTTNLIEPSMKLISVNKHLFFSEFSIFLRPEER